MAGGRGAAAAKSERERQGRIHERSREDWDPNHTHTRTRTRARTHTHTHTHTHIFNALADGVHCVSASPAGEGLGPKSGRLHFEDGMAHQYKDAARACGPGGNPNPNPDSDPDAVSPALTLQSHSDL